MSFRARLQALGPPGRTICLATHMGTLIDNETNDSTLQLASTRLHREQDFQRMFVRRRAPVSGYNCFGHVFAGRRTAIYDVSQLERILQEDGFGSISEPYSEGDIVVYYDNDGPQHVAQLIRFEGSGSEPIVLSKFDDVSGEYEHPLSNIQWAAKAVPIVRWLVFRARYSSPTSWSGSSRRCNNADNAQRRIVL